MLHWLVAIARSPAISPPLQLSGWWRRSSALNSPVGNALSVHRWIEDTICEYE
jgi:hypothetical protein